MATAWRDELRQRLDRIQGEDSPPPLGVEIVVPAHEMSVFDHDIVLGHAGQRNDATFCEAAPGTLEISFTGSWEKHPRLRFHYRPRPPEGFRWARDGAPPCGEHGEVPEVITGVDFGALPE